MIQFTQGDILQANVEALVNTVNCVGVMGRGVALQFKQAFPANFKAYAAACACNEVQPGRMFVTETGQLAGPRYIINFPTKRHWRGASRIEDIDAGLVALVTEIQQRGIRSIAIPPLGSGLGGLDWNEIRPRIERALAELSDVNVVIFEPHAANTDAPIQRVTNPPPMTPGRASLVGLIDRYLAALLDPFITLLEVHKLMYFLQEAGEPLRLRYVKGPYGPYAENLRHVLRAIEGYWVAGYADGGDAPAKQLMLMFTGSSFATERLNRNKSLKPSTTGGRANGSSPLNRLGLRQSACLRMGGLQQQYHGDIDSVQMSGGECYMADDPHSTRNLAMSDERRQATVRLINEWLTEESGYDQAVWLILQQRIEENRLSRRPRFQEQRRMQP